MQMRRLMTRCTTGKAQQQCAGVIDEYRISTKAALPAPTALLREPGSRFSLAVNPLHRSDTSAARDNASKTWQREEMNAKAELAEFVNDYLSRKEGGIELVALGAVITGLASILSAYRDAQERRGNWGAMLGNLRDGVAEIERALPLLREHGGPGVATVIELAEQELAFAGSMHDEIVRLTAGESTNV